MKILIVEDDQILAECLRDFLLDMSHEEVKICMTAEEARDAVRGMQYDCVFIDLRLPDTDGLCLLDTIRTSNPDIPAVMMSGYPTMEIAIEAMRKGASDFLAKPFRFDDLALTVERVTRERRLLLENLSLNLETRASKHVKELNRELQGKVREQNKLFKLFGEIDAIGSSESLYPYIVSVASRLTAAEKVGFFIFSGESNSLLLISDHGLDEKQKMARVFPLQNGWLEQLRDSNINHVMINGKNLGDELQMRTLFGLDAKLACWPFRIRGQLFGFLLTCHSASSQPMTEGDLKLVDVLVKKAALTIENMALYENLVTNFYGILKSLVNALEAKDVYTRKHSERVTEYAVGIARRMSCSETQIEALKTMGHLHDIGKIGIADKILNKTGPLTAEEYELIKKHPVIGESIVLELGLNQDQRAIIRYHHERWDGKGYPEGLATEEVPLLARIIAVADAFDSMTSLRAYRAKMSKIDAIRELRANQGKQFDPRVVEAFLEDI